MDGKNLEVAGMRVNTADVGLAAGKPCQLVATAFVARIRHLATDHQGILSSAATEEAKDPGLEMDASPRQTEEDPPDAAPRTECPMPAWADASPERIDT